MTSQEHGIWDVQQRGEKFPHSPCRASCKIVSKSDNDGERQQFQSTLHSRRTALYACNARCIQCSRKCVRIVSHSGTRVCAYQHQVRHRRWMHIAALWSCTKYQISRGKDKPIVV